MDKEIAHAGVSTHNVNILLPAVLRVRPEEKNVIAVIGLVLSGTYVYSRSVRIHGFPFCFYICQESVGSKNRWGEERT